MALKSLDFRFLASYNFVMRQFKQIAVLSLFLIHSSALADSAWLGTEVGVATQKILANTAAPGSAPGAVIASPSQMNPNYYYHWVRDAALTMDRVVSLWQSTTDGGQKQIYFNRILHYLSFSRANQTAVTLTGLGEPKFNVDGSPFNGPWGRPQNDGPALRAITAIHFATILISQGQVGFVRANLYDSNLPTNSLIKADLEYVSHHWQESSFDLWEETLGDHFYTRMVQRKALLLGAKLASSLNDSGAAAWYQSQAMAIESSLKSFWDPNKNYVVATLNPRGGVNYKNSNLDIAVILGALHGGMGDGFFDVRDTRILNTMQALVQHFASLYPINQQRTLGAALGRYPEDRYNGSGFNGGNPWVLSTLAAAEFYYRLGALRRSASDVALADAFVQTVANHAYPNGSLSEQIDRNSGYMVSAGDLTWNYAAILSTASAK